MMWEEGKGESKRGDAIGSCACTNVEDLELDCNK